MARMNWYDEQLHKWEAVAHTWHEGEPPAVPSAEDLQAFSGAALAASRGSDATLVVLGATVALRRALLTDPKLTKAQLIIVDFSREMLRVTTEFLSQNLDLSREQYVVSDWRDLPDAIEQPVDAVMGDKSFDNLAFSDWRAVLEGCATVLRDDGILTLHVGLVDPRYIGLDVDRCLAEWAKRVGSGARTLGEAAAGLWEDLLTASAYVGDPSAHELSVAKFAPRLRELTERYTPGTAQAQVLAEFTRTFGSSNEARWTAFTLADLYEQAEPWFAPSRVSTSRDYDAASQQPIVELVRKARLEQND
jgi:ubiquinone/menaquinone biosynthesis C-methylase UbiE